MKREEISIQAVLPLLEIKIFLSGVKRDTKILPERNNFFLGEMAGSRNESGENNIMLGRAAGGDHSLLSTVCSGFTNIFIGFETGYKNTSGSNNIFLGEFVGSRNTGGEFNFFAGYKTGGNQADNSTEITGQRNNIIGTFCW